MLRYLLRRLFLLLATLFIISLIAYTFQRLHSPITALQVGNIEGYWQFMNNTFQGEFGQSSVSGKPVMYEITYYLPATIELCLSALFLAAIIGIPLGTLAGFFHQRPMGQAILSLSLLGQSIPIFWLPFVLMMNLSQAIGWFPVSGRYDLLIEVPHITGFALIDVFALPEAKQLPALMNVLQHLILPAAVLAVLPASELTRQLANATMRVMEQNYIKAAYTMGLSKFHIMWRHVLHNALPPILPALGLQFGSLLTSAMVLEVVFSWPGIGRWLIASVDSEDYMAITGGMLVVASLAITMFVITDIISTLSHPLRKRGIYEQD